MGTSVTLSSTDGHDMNAYSAPARSERKGAVVIVQEIFGVNGHIRDVCDRYASEGYDAIAPALFDRIRPGVELGYDQNGIEEGRRLAAAAGWDDPVRDIAAAAQAVDSRGEAGVIGFCWGASWTWLAACRADLGCAICYYGRHIVEFLEEAPRCPVLLQFGAEDASIPLENVDRIRAAYPDMAIQVYEGAGHGFNCDRRSDYRQDIAELAFERTRMFLREHLFDAP